jgi:hypothetical protein
MLGSILEWFYAALLGLKPDGDGYRSFTVTPPYISEFNSVRGVVDCPYGKIEIEFKRGHNGYMQLNLTVPMSTTATVVMPKELKSLELSRRGTEVEAEVDKTLMLRHGQYSLHLQV